ncbi:hypothetical protein [Alkalihalobacterium elongatum]|uniref:hypothetical protein n=1 Tax=Alkalihalobacterium elongatum TaxID=2675466 RepID=UPI001C1FA923|nr:hypothetical protein [Alkalihalobacterium elongatum]
MQFLIDRTLKGIEKNTYREVKLILGRKFLTLILTGLVASLIVPFIFPINMTGFEEISDRSLRVILGSYSIFPMFFYGGLLIYGLPVSLLIDIFIKRLEGINRDIASFVLYVISSIPIIYIEPLFGIYSLCLAINFFIVETIIKRLNVKYYWRSFFVFTAIAIGVWFTFIKINYNFLS